jgi:hypothetical protein
VKVAFVVAHPGHELRLARWFITTKPFFFIIAKGSRSAGCEARIQASRAMAVELGAVPVEPFGLAFDRLLYSWILAGNGAAFGALADGLRDAFVARDISLVVTDAWQNYNPVHDLTHLLARVAAAEAGDRLRRPVEVLDYPVVQGGLAGAACGAERTRIALTKVQIADKLALISRRPELSGELTDLLEAAGRDVLHTETLHDTRPLIDLEPTVDAPPLYECYGEMRVASGLYAEVLRWSHMEPIVASLASRLAAAGRH